MTGNNALKTRQRQGATKESEALVIIHTRFDLLVEKTAEKF